MQPVSRRHLELLADAQQEHADHREHRSEPGAQARLVADEQSQQRHDNDIEAGDEAGVGHGGEQQTDLLQVDTHRQSQPHQ